MRYYIGLMSGTSLDGVDGVLIEMGDQEGHMQQLAASYVPFTSDIRASLFALQFSGFDEIHRVSQAANQIVLVYAECVLHLLKNTGLYPEKISAIGVHGQTVRHRPEFGYTIQINNPALLAELTNIDVIADFRSRDIAAGGQGAPLVPAFHRSVFGKSDETRVVANIGGISNISILRSDGATRGFDTGPGNVLMDAWMMQHKSQAFDTNGDWARHGQVNYALLDHLKDDPFFHKLPPKSTGRDLFHMDWLNNKLRLFRDVSPVNVQATLCAFTADTLVEAIEDYASDVSQVYICGGGAYNKTLIEAIHAGLNSRERAVSVESTEVLGISPNHVEALAFAWLAYRHIERIPGNLPEVTGAAGGRILGALYPR
ncbi:anhydro-N-acetylmuramic acid kinase [Oxalobacteraceae bacterium GrIS 2.11]